MEELIQRLQDMHGISAEQARGVLSTITGYVKEKFPMVGGAIDNIFPAASAPSTAGGTTTDATATSATSDGDSGIMDKISTMITGSEGEKMEEFAKDKLGGFFGK
jgi:hypothetical protein